MKQRIHREFTAAENMELWDRWQRGELLKLIGRAFARRCFLVGNGASAHRWVHCNFSRKLCLDQKGPSTRLLSPLKLLTPHLYIVRVKKAAG